MKNLHLSKNWKRFELALACAILTPTRHFASTFTLVAVAFLSSVSLSIAAPESVVQTVTYNGETITMRMQKENLRGDNFELWSQNAAGEYDVITPVSERSYMGSVDNYPGAVSCGVLLDDGTFKGAVYFDRGVTWFTVGSSVNFTRAEDYGAFSNFQIPTASTVTAGQAGSEMYAYELGVDVDYDYFTSRNSSVASTLETIEYSVCVVRAIYMRDALLRPYLGRVIVRSTLAHDPYTGLTQGNYLSAVKTEWETNHSDTNPALVAGSSPNKIGGGLAWVGSVGAGNRYSVSQSGSGEFNVVFRHEMGHNWGCSHYVGGSPEGTGLMGGNQAGRFSGPELYRVFNHRDSRIATGGILDSEGTYTAIELPPYASLDFVEFEIGSTISLPIDVLANDHDSNGQTLTVNGFDSTTANGGTVTQQGNELVYTPVNGAFLGLDSFSYTITDSAGKTATGISLVNVVPAATTLVLHLPLDETSGLTADDQTAFNNNGAFYALDGVDFSTNSTTGQYGNALNFNGQFARLQAPSFSQTGNTLTLSTWIKPSSTPAPWAGIIMDDSAQKSGLSFGTAGELRYHWDGAYSDWDSGLIPPVGTWTFVSLVIEPSSATIYMDSGSGFQSATNMASHAPTTFRSPFIGWSSGDFFSKFFTGAIDDVRIYDEAMTQPALRAAYNGGTIESSVPFDGSWGNAQTDLSWSPAIGALQYHVYLGTDKNTVLNATTASAEYLGAVSSTSYANPTLDPKTTYYWRVDTERASETLTGAIWKFTRGPSESLVITNHSFEEGATGGGTPPGWTVDSGPGVGVGSDGGSDGARYIYFAPGTSLTQDLNHTIATGEELTLQFESDRAYARNVQLLAKTGGTYTLLAESTVATGDSSWPTIQLDHTVASAYNGQQLALRILNGSEWLQLDNFRITSSGTPSSPPSWSSSNLSRPAANEDSAYASSLASEATDPEGNSLTYAKLSGPDWLQVADDGSLSGTPLSADVGEQSWEVYVTDLFTTPVVVTLHITVINSQDAPVFVADPFSAANASKGLPYSASIAGSAIDEDSADILTYTKVSGPAWLVISSDGSLSGMAGISDLGLNAFTVQVSDNNGGDATATLNITVENTTSTIFSDDFERTAGSTINSGWLETANDSRIYDTSDNATKMVISVTQSQTFAMVNSLAENFTNGEGYELNWNAARAASALGTLNYDVAIGTWDGSTFTPLANQAGSMSNLNDTAKHAGPVVTYTATSAEAGKAIAIMFSTEAGSTEWVGFDDIVLTSTAQPDADLDGIPAYWETANGLDPASNDTAGDNDLDGSDNYFEYITDTDPQSSSAGQTFIVDRGTETDITFSSSVNRRYTVEYSDDLGAASWLPLHSQTVGTGSEISQTDTSPNGKRFYRLKIALP